MMDSENKQITPVDPARLESGRWCHQSNRTIGEGDISASYSADTIAMAGRIRKPLTWNGGTWVCASMRRTNGETSAECYQLLHPQVFEGEATTYFDRSVKNRSSINEALGFYHGMTVKSGGTELVLCGPPRSFVRGETEQLSLFENSQ